MADDSQERETLPDMDAAGTGRERVQVYGYQHAVLPAITVMRELPHSSRAIRNYARRHTTKTRKVCASCVT
jgi:hypothetical protein